jgi:D-glycero-D-manno-heptose 1,7-bisphosphate phosphatase
MTRPFLLLDRDGVINHESRGYIRCSEEWQPISGSLEAIAALTQAGVDVFVLTNQSGIGRGYYSLDDLAKIHEKMHASIEQAGGLIRAVYFCPHDPDKHCDCRKPAPAMFLQCAKEFDLDLSKTWYVGDKLSDLQAADNVGAKAALVLTGYGQKTLADLPKEHGYAVFADLTAFVNYFLEQQR